MIRPAPSPESLRRSTAPIPPQPVPVPPSPEQIATAQLRLDDAARRDRCTVRAMPRGQR